MRKNKLKKNVILSMSLALMLTFTSVSACFATDIHENLSEAAEVSKVSFAEKNYASQLAELKINHISAEEISSLKSQIEVYHPTEEQVENYVKDLIENEEGEEKVNFAPIEYEKTENGDTITPYGVIPKQDLSQKWSNLRGSTLVSSLSNRTNAADQTGVYYVVNGTAGHNQITSFATLPTLSNVYSDDRPYLMYAMSSKNGNKNMYGDIGLVYFPDSGKWKGFYNVYEGDFHDENYTFNFTGGKNIYLHLQIFTNKAVLIVRDANSWKEVCRVEYKFNTNCIPKNFTRVYLGKQVTLAQMLDSSGKLNISTGTVMKNAKFSQTYLYTPSTNYEFKKLYCYEAYRQGPTAAAYKKVTASYTAWTEDTVTISFN